MPTSKEPRRPGFCVTAIASTSLTVMLAFFKVSSKTIVIFSVCILDAISGTTPPKFA